MLLPPVVSGPLTTASTGVWVAGAVDGAAIQLQANNVPIGAPLLATGLHSFVPVSAGGLVAGDSVPATQSYAGQTSAPTPHAHRPIVAAMPTESSDLPAVVFLSGLHPWVDWVKLGGLIPGCTVEIFHAGKRAASIVARSSTESVPLRPQSAPNAGDVLEAWQSITLSGGAVLSGPKTASLPMAPRGRNDPAAPAVAAPIECDLAVLVSALEEGVSLVVNHGSDRLQGYPYVGSPVWAGLTKPARPGDTFTVQQEFTRWGIESPQSTPPVGVIEVNRLPVPLIHGPICPNASGVRISNLRPGATVKVSVKRAGSTGGASVLLGAFRAWAVDCNVPLPETWAQGPQLNGPGPLTIEALQTNCNKSSDAGSCPVGALPGNIGTPHLAPAVACSRWVIGSGLTAGAWVEVLSDEPDWPQLASAVPVYSSVQAIAINRPLRKGEGVRIRQSGCNANRDSEVISVSAFTGVGTPTIQTVRIPHGGVWLSGLMVGARVHVFVDGALRASADVTQPSLFVQLSGLVRGQHACAQQTMCSEIGPRTSEVDVTLGRIKVDDITPNPIVRTRPTIVHVTTIDADSGQPIAGSVVIGQQAVGTTNQDFAYTFGPGAAPASLVVAKDYFSEPIRWPLEDAPVVLPTLLLTVSNQSGMSYDLTSVDWIVYKQTGGTVAQVAAGQGPSCFIPLAVADIGAQMHLVATVSALNKATDDIEIAEFRGNNPPPGINGQSTFMRVLAAGNSAISFKLINEPQEVWNGGYSFTLNKAVVLYEAG